MPKVIEVKGTPRSTRCRCTGTFVKTSVRVARNATAGYVRFCGDSTVRKLNVDPYQSITSLLVAETVLFDAWICNRCSAMKVKMEGYGDET